LNLNSIYKFINDGIFTAILDLLSSQVELELSQKVDCQRGI